jgi:O-antigen/teichoic acid export membrane protein
MLISIAKLSTQAAVGEFALAQAITAPVMIMSQMQLRQLHVTDVQRSAALGDYLGARLLTTLVALAVIAAIGATVTPEDMAAVLAAMAVAKAAESVSDIAHGQLQRAERLDLVAVSLTLKGVLSLAVLTAALLLGGSLFMAVTAMMLVWVLVLVVYDLPAASRLRAPGEPLLAWRPQLLRRLLWTALPLTLASGLSSLSGNLPRYFLGTFDGKEAVALFTVGATPLMVVALVNTAVTQATLPRAASLLQGGEFDSFDRVARRVVAVQVGAGVVLALVFGFFGNAIMRTLFTPEYASASRVALLLAIGVSLSGLAAYGATVLAAARRFWLQLGNITVAVLVQLPLCMILIPRMGIMGAGVAEVMKYIVATIYLASAGYFVLASARSGVRAERAPEWQR